MATATNGKVILYMPHLLPPGQKPSDYMAVPPLSYLALGTPLRDAGYDPILIDGKWEPDARRQLAELAPSALALGISSLTGYSVQDGLEASQVAKQVNPRIPVVWGGWHPSYAARQAVEDPRVDVVVRGQGERTFIEVLDAIREGRSLESIPGVTFRDGTRIVETPDRASEDINEFPPPAYDLIDPTRYITRHRTGVRQACTIFSRGCPYYCDFCLDSRKKWWGLSLDRMAEDLKFWVLRNGANHCRLYDGNFFLGRDRLMAFSNMIRGGELAGKFTWSATGVANRMILLDSAVLANLRNAGCESVAIGAESGSDELLSQITNKTTVEHTTEAVRLLTAHGINQYLFFMVGFPEEPVDALEQTLRLIVRLKRINPRFDFQISFCIPLPGSGMFEIAVNNGWMERPRTFMDWTPMHYLRPSLPHITPEYARKVKRFIEYLLLMYPSSRSSLSRLLQSRTARVLYSPLREAARMRVENLAFGFPVEAMLYEMLSQVRDRASGAPRVAQGI